MLRQLAPLNTIPKYQNSLCLAYLGGFGIKNSRSLLPNKEYFADGSKEEWEARETLAFLLRNQETLSPFRANDAAKLIGWSRSNSTNK